MNLKTPNKSDSLLHLFKAKLFARCHADVIRRERTRVFQEAKDSWNSEILKNTGERDQALIDKYNAIMANERNHVLEGIRIKSKADEVEKGERSTLFFHNTLKQRGENITISQIQNTIDPTIMHDDPDEILTEIRAY